MGSFQSIKIQHPDSGGIEKVGYIFCNFFVQRDIAQKDLVAMVRQLFDFGSSFVPGGPGAKCPALAIHQFPGGTFRDRPIPDDLVPDQNSMQMVVFELIEKVGLLDLNFSLCRVDRF